MRLEGKIAVIVGAGQSPGEGIGNGRATTLRFAQEGARILAVDRLMAAAEETASMVVQAGGECAPFAADVTKEETLAAAVGAARARWGRIDILHNNVGVSIAGGDKPLEELTEEAFDRVCAINLRGTIMACKHVLPIMRRQRAGAIVNISSVAARENSYPLVAYKATKAAIDRLHRASPSKTRHTAFAPTASCPVSWIRRWPSTRALAPATAAAPKSPRSATPRFRCVTAWGRHGMSRMRRCFSPPTRPILLPVSHCRSTGAHWCGSVEPPPCASRRVATET
jgi:NAD(P)-dependent dehydrogenase (short-subunit alcohol dehydrogenase family)